MVTASYLVQADFSGTAFGGSPTWTDITSYVLTTSGGQPITVSVGRQDELSDVSPSTCSFTLVNDDGRFTPGRSSSPYYPHVLPGVRVRVSTTVPLTAATNLVTNPSFEVDTSGWSTGFTIARSTAQAYTGTASLLCTTGASTNSAAYTAVTLTGGVTYTWSVYVYLTSVGAGDAIYIDCTGPGSLDTTNVQVDTTKLNQWQRVTATFTTISTGAHNVRVVQQGTAASTFYLDAAQLEAGSVATDYFDGSVAGCSWTGTANASTSTRPSSYTTYRFDGYVDSWQQGWDNGGPASLVRVNCSDILARFGTQQPLKALYVEEAWLDTPLALWPLTEASGATSAGNISTTQQSALTVTASADVTSGDATFGDGTGIPNDGVSCLTLNTSLTADSGDDLKGYYLTGTAPTLTINGTWTLECWLRVDPNLAAAIARHTQGGVVIGVPVLGVTAPTGDILAAISLWWDGTALRVAYGTSTNSSNTHAYTYNTTVAITSAATHHVALSCSAGSITGYIDGASNFTASAATGSTSGGKVLIGGFAPDNFLYGLAPNYRGTVEYAALYTTALSAARVAAHYSAAQITGNERSDTHVGRLLSYRPNTGSSLATGSGNIGAHDTTNTTLQQALLDTAKAEGGLLWADGQGRVTLKARSTQYDPTVAATLDATSAQITADVGFHIDTQQLTNDVTMTRSNGAAQRVLDTTSQNTYGVRATSDTLIVAADSDALDAANWRLANNKDAKPRSPNLTVDLLTEPSTTIAQNVLGITPWNRVTVVDLPTVAPATTQTVWVQGWTEQIAVDNWTVTFNTTPVPLQALVWDNATYGVWDTDAWGW